MTSTDNDKRDPGWDRAAWSSLARWLIVAGLIISALVHFFLLRVA
jgi:uncharacterized membrane protein YhhN